MASLLPPAPLAVSSSAFAESAHYGAELSRGRVRIADFPISPRIAHQRAGTSTILESLVGTTLFGILLRASVVRARFGRTHTSASSTSKQRTKKSVQLYGSTLDGGIGSARSKYDNFMNGVHQGYTKVDQERRPGYLTMEKMINSQIIPEWQNTLAALRKLRLRDLKRELEALGCKTASCFDKEQLMELLETQGKTVLKAAWIKENDGGWQPDANTGGFGGSAIPQFDDGFAG